LASTEAQPHDAVPPAEALSRSGSQWQSRQIVVTPELLGMRSTIECQQRAEKLGLTPLPWLPRRQEYWRLDVLLMWSRANGLDRLPWLGQGSAQHR
jgi:hypothetical protein